MRLDELVVGPPGHEVRIAFHPRMTVMAGMGVIERRAMVDALAQAATGQAANAELTFYDPLGRHLHVYRVAGRAEVEIDEETWPSGAPRLSAPPAETLAVPAVIGPRELGLLPEVRRGEEPPELLEARASLAEAERLLDQARMAEKQAEAADRAVAEVDGRIRAYELGAPRRRYARVLGALRDARAEAEVLAEGQLGAMRDRALLGMADRLGPAIARWQAAGVQAAERVRAWGDRPRLDPMALAEARRIPDTVPADLERLVADLEVAEEAKRALTARLFELAANRLPEPSDPAVADLARVDQVGLWATHTLACEATAMLDAERVALGGIGSSEEVNTLIAAIEAAHADAEASAERARKLFFVGTAAGGIGAALTVAGLDGSPVVPGVGMLVAAGGFAATVFPHRRAKAARKAEGDALAQVGASTYLSFHMRRLEAVMDPAAQHRLQQVAGAHKAALKAWHEVAGGITVEQAAGLRAEVAGYAEALRALGGTAAEIEAVRSELADVVGPVADDARRRLVAACEAFGIGDEAGRVVDQIRARIAAGLAARQQWELEAAEGRLVGAEAELAGVLDELLGPSPGAAGLADRAREAEATLQAAARREEARRRARPVQEVQAELARLAAEEVASRCPDWQAVSPDDGVEPDMAALAEERRRIALLAGAARTQVPDVVGLLDRQAALARRVAALEQQAAGLFPAGLPIDLPQLYDQLLARLALARHGGLDGDTIPTIMDDPFVHVPAGHKWDLLDMVERLAEGGQVVYLTDDPYVAAWGKRRHEAGAVRLLASAAH